MRIFAALRPHSRWYREVDAYVDGELSAASLTRFEAHLRTCERCTSAVEARRSLKQSVASLPVPQISRSFRITPELAARPARVPASAPARLALRATVALASLALVAFGSTLVIDLNGYGRSAVPATAPSLIAGQSASVAASPTRFAAPAVPQAAPQKNADGGFGAAAPPSPTAVNPPEKSALHAVGTPQGARSTDHRGLLRPAEIISGVFAVVFLVAVVILVRKQRRALP